MQEQKKQQEGFKLLLLSEDVRGQRSSKLTRNDRDEKYTNTRACQMAEAVHQDYSLSCLKLPTYILDPRGLYPLHI